MGLRNELLVVSAAGMWGCLGPFIKASKTPWYFNVLARLIIGNLAVQTVILLRSKNRLKLSDVHFGETLLIGASYGVGVGFITAAFTFAPASTLSPLFYAWVPLTLVAGMVSKWVEADWRNIAAAVLGCVSIGLLIVSDRATARTSNYFAGIVMIFVAAVLTSAKMMYFKSSTMNEVESIDRLFTQNWLAGAVASIIVLYLILNKEMALFRSIGNYEIVLWITMSFLVSFLAYYYYFEALPNLKVNVISSLSFLEVIVTIILAFLFNNDMKTSRTTNILGLQIPIFKVLAVLAIGASIALSH